jgi:hypothetical protein
MSEALQADINIATHSAFQQMQNLLGAISTTEKSLTELDGAVKSAEGRIGGLSAALTKATEEFQKTGSEADRLKMEELQRALQQSKERAESMRAELGKLQGEFKQVTKSQTDMAKETTRASREASAAVETSANSQVESHRRTGRIINETKGGSEGLTGSLENLAGAAKGMIAGFFGLQTIAKLFEEMDQHTQAMVAAREKLGEAKTTLESSVRSIVSNADLISLGKTGETRALKVVQALQGQAPGVSAEVAAEVLSKAQATGYQVIDKNRPETDTKLPGFQVAAEAAKFAGPNQLDPATAGNMLNVAKAVGVRNKEQMEKFLAMWQESFYNISITDPRAGTEAATAAVLGRISQHMDPKFAMAGFAASAAMETNAMKAATANEQFTRVAVGADPTRKLVLAKLARERGLITDDAFAAARTTVAPGIETHGDEIESQQAIIERAQRERRDVTTDLAEREAQHTFTLSQSAKERNAAKRDERERKENADFEKAHREADEKITDSRNREKAAREKIADLSKKDTRKISDAALLQAYSGLPLQAKEQMLWDVTAPMTDAQRSVFGSQVAEGDVAQQFVKQLAPAAREAREAVLSGAGGDVNQLRATYTGFAQLSGTQADIAKIESERALAAAAPAGQDFWNRIAGTGEGAGEGGMVQKDIVALRARGQGRANFFGGGLRTSNLPLVARVNPEENAASEAGLRARRSMIIAWEQWQRFRRTMDPKTFARFKGRIEAVEAAFRLARDTEVFRQEGPGSTGGSQLAAAQKNITWIGALMQEIQADVMAHGGNEVVPVASPQGLGLPGTTGTGEVIESSFRVGTGEVGADLPRGVVNSPGAAVPPPAAAPIGPQSRVINYNIGIGTVVSQGADDLILPGRLSEPDLG